ncbi:plasmid partition protein ParG [Erwinia pyrifoliae]|uniref:plasmid partition protein ParG n=1 Tax=Erwinia pyrifoliae TaxID=79967 RepID=UPI00223B0C01|nr:plasmid partition protein ParG [Erwinia pyrifoliae]MCT2388843.1 plasmid partition protein ParG [Erwinia pyrifoliae]MCU8589016.1 plasmid partition protein ParG [Erwinia pyrifoliae]
MKMKLGQHRQLAPALDAVTKPVSGSTKKLQTNIDEKLHRRFKTACFLQGWEMKDVLTGLIEHWLSENEPS